MLWAVTTYFNPFNDKRRADNFEEFRRHIGLRLLVVEVALPATQHTLVASSVDCLVRIHGDVMWQKERAYNIALNWLPTTCDRVLFIDADVVNTSPTKWAATQRALDSAVAVHPFSRVEYLRADGSVDFVWPSIAQDRSLFTQGAAVAQGTAWAFQRDFIARHRFHDKFIVGGGDVALTAALFGRTQLMRERAQMNASRSAAYQAWAAPLLHDSIPCPKHTTDVVRHLWHGSEASRKYHERKAILNDFNPDTDLRLTTGGGLRWQHAPDERVRRIANDVHAYMCERGRED